MILLASETVNAIFGAERKNAEKIDEAKLKASQMIVAAEKEASVLTAAAIESAKQKARSIEDEARKKAASFGGNTDSADVDKNFSFDKKLFADAVAAVKAKVLDSE